VFGALKSTARKIFQDAPARESRMRVTKPWAVQLLIQSWKRFARPTVESAWDCYSLDKTLDAMPPRVTEVAKSTLTRSIMVVYSGTIAWKQVMPDIPFRPMKNDQTNRELRENL
jgi:hypothetical protein